MMVEEPRIDRLTSSEVESAVSDGARTAILPLGAIEQHGPHLPLSVDSDHADALAVRVARRLGSALVLPTIRVGYSPHHLSFAGTLSLRASTLEAVCLDYCSGLASHGFDRVVLFSAHIGNYPIMRKFEQRLVDALSPDLQVIVFGDGRLILQAWRAVSPARAELVGGHADIAETSVMFALHPEKVRAERAAAGYMGPVDDALLQRAFVDGIQSISPNGVLGDPSGMTEEIGHSALDAVTELIVNYAQSHGA